MRRTHVWHRLVTLVLIASLGPFGSAVPAALADDLGAELDAHVVTKSGDDPAEITSSVDECRANLGAPNNVANPPAASGRREINWDGTPDQFSAPNNLPADFFNTTSPRGVVFSTPGTGFQVSADSSNPTATPIEFGNLNPAYPTQFQTFSPERLFTPLGSNVMDVDFFVPGTNVPATVNGFGAVFTDVEQAGSSRIEYFDEEGVSLGTFSVPPGSNEGLSILCVVFRDERVSRVRITSGNVAPSAAANDGGGVDVAVMDDFLYGEPLAPDCFGRRPTVFAARTGTTQGTAGDDVIIGTNGDDNIQGLGGNDRICGLAGNDILNGVDGNDLVDGGAGNDLVIGAGGDDTLLGGIGNDRLFGGIGNDQLDGGDGNDELNGLAGVDTLRGGAGNDTLRGGTENDLLFGEAGDDRLEGEAGNDRLEGGDGNDFMLGGAGNDIMLGGPGVDRLFGEAGNDRLEGGDGSDQLNGGVGIDICNGGNGVDLLPLACELLSGFP